MSLDDYLLGKIFMYIPYDLHNIAKNGLHFKKVIEEHPILQHVHKIGLNKKLCEFATMANRRDILEYAIGKEVPFGNSCKMAARAGNLKLLEYLYPIEVERIQKTEIVTSIDNDQDLQYECCVESVKNDNTHCIDYLLHVQRDDFNVLCPEMIEKICKYNAWDCLKYFLDNDYNLEETPYCHYNLIEKFGLRFVKYYQNLGFELNDDMCKFSIGAEDFECFKYMFENGCNIISEEDLINAFDIFGVDFVEVYYAKNGTIPSELYQLSISRRHCDEIKYLIEHNCELTDEIVNYALNEIHNPYFDELHNGLIKIIRMFLNAGYILNENNVKSACASKNLNSFKYLIRNGVDVSNCVEDIFKTNELNFIRYALESDIIPRDTSVRCSEYFSQNWNCDGLKYLVSNGYKLSEKCIYIAIEFYHRAKNDSIDCIEYLYDNGYKWENDRLDNMNVSPNNDKMTTFLIKNGYITTKAVELVICRDNVELLKYLYINGITLTKELCVQSVRYRCLKCFKFINEKGHKMTEEEFYKCVNYNMYGDDDELISDMTAIVEHNDNSDD